MDDPPSLDYFRSLARRIRPLDDDRGGELLGRAFLELPDREARRTTPALGAAGAPTRTRRTRRPPVALRKGLTLINRLREDEWRRHLAPQRRDLDQADRAAMTLAPARFMRRRRDGSGYAFPKQYRDAVDIIHEPAYLLMDLDAACGRALESWVTRAQLRRRRRGHRRRVRVGSHPGTALVIGALFRLIQFPFVAEDAKRLLRTAATLEIPGDLKKLTTVLTKHPEWQRRIRRCDYDRGAGEGCYRYFVDNSPAGNARGCHPGHAVRLVESQGARKPYRPRKPLPRRRRRTP